LRALVLSHRTGIDQDDSRNFSMPEPTVELDIELDLPFMREQEDEEPVDEEEVDGEDGDDDEEAEPEEVLERMQSAVPADAVSLGTLEYDIAHSPGLSWKIEDHFYLLPLRDAKYEWALVRITWDDNFGTYEWANDAVGSGFSDARAAARAMVAAVFESWTSEDDGEAAEARSEFLNGL
jgi:hypothetical protein